MLWILSGIGLLGAVIYLIFLIREICSSSRKLKCVRKLAVLAILFTGIFAVSVLALCDIKQSYVETVKTAKYVLTSVKRNNKSVYVYRDINDTYTYHYKSENGPKSGTIFVRDAYIEESDDCTEPRVIQKDIETNSKIGTSWHFFLTFHTDYDFRKEYYFCVPTGTVE